MSTIFVTGGAGFIGRAFCAGAELLGHDVVVFDQVHGENVLHAPQLNDMVKRTRPDWIVHLAATPGVAGSMAASLDQVVGMHNVLMSTLRGDTTKILFVSTGSIYGEQTYFPTYESAALKPQTGFYAAGKLSCEGLLSAWCAKHGDTGISLRLGTIIGPGNRKGLIYDFVKKLRQNPDELAIWGDGRQAKSYLHIEDLVSAMFAAIEYGDEGLGYDVFNVAHDAPATVTSVANIVADTLGLEKPPAFKCEETTGFGDIPRIHLSNEKLRALGWEPKHTIPEAVSANVRWLLENPEVFG